MNTRFAPPLHSVTLSAQDDFDGWRTAARAMLSADMAPDRLCWTVAGDGATDLFATEDAPSLPVATDTPLRVGRDLLRLLRAGLLHSDPRRFALGYRLLWRLREDPRLALDPADPDMIALGALAKSVRRDLHKMHAFVRFRKVGEMGGREQYAAWFEPDHHIGRAVAGFFRDRFAGMDWLIVMPQVSISWDGTTLNEGPGGSPADVPESDAVEAEWCAYYASIFNPARVKIAAMKKEMPVRYWRNLPESALITSLTQNASNRVDDMVLNSRQEGDLFAAAGSMETSNRQFESLGALYEALEREDQPPSEGFSSHIVRGEGPMSAPILLVGEQPGDQEDIAMRPFVGPAGQLLDTCLAEAGIDRERAFLTNAVKRFKFTPRGKRRLHATPNAGDIAHYRWWLAEEIRLVDPVVVVALGASALHALTGRKQALAPVRGQIMPWEDRRLLATVHPSFLLRLPDEQGRMIEQGKMVRELHKAAEAASG
ncbi:MAG: UdgX family uracil-DNA binding protein [Sphingobium sp.]